MNKKILLTSVSALLLLMTSLTGCSSTSSDNGLSDEQKVINHLKSNGTGSYHYVSTGTYTRLGYDGDYFYTSYNEDYKEMKYSLATCGSFNDSSVSVAMTIYYNNTIYLAATWTATVSNHYYSSSSIFDITINEFPSSQSFNLATIMIDDCNKAINNANSYLLDNGLPYIYSASSESTKKLYTYTDSTKTSLYFGSYPQTKVSDSSLISTLNTTAGTLPTSEDTYKWTDYGYYEKGSIKSYMYYIDIDQDNDGSNDYRGVYFTQYRPYYTTTSSSNNYQSTNGYTTNTIYWFKYEPIKWDILKLEDNKALIISDLILDSQDYFYNTDNRSNIEDYQGNSSTSTIYPNNYMYSHIRSWLNTTFYQSAFNTLEQQIIQTTTVDNSASSTSSSSNSYACANTNDKMFLLSYKDVNTYYSSNDERISKGSDYAKSQGLYVYTSTSSYNGNYYYWLRSPDYYYSDSAGCVDNDGYISHYYACRVNYTDDGVRAACWINL